MPLYGNKTYRIFENCLSNINKYALAYTRVYVDVTQDDKQVKIVFKNVSNQEMDFDSEHIMERFVQGDKSLTRLNEGSGIGLSIVKSIVELNNGEIYLDSDGENGTEFEILLPNEKLEGDKYEYNYEIDIDKIELEFSDIYELYS